jgi:hypothetical protein
MAVASAAWLAGAAVAAYVTHSICRSAASNAYEQWAYEQKYQANRDRDESYHFQMMDDRAYYRAEGGDALWRGVAMVCPRAPLRPQMPKTPIGGGGT